MKSGRFEVLPRVRKLSDGSYKCTWKDPGRLTQYRGKPLQYVNVFIGLGDTPDKAMEMCRLDYARFMIKREITWDKIAKDFFDEAPPAKRYDLPERLQATSNLPWWKRLFRV